MALFTAIGAAVGAVGTFIGSLGAVGALMLNTAVGVGVNLLAQAVAGKPKQAAGASFGINGTLQAGGDIPRSFILGQYATAGSLAWVNTWGQDGETPNAYLTQVIAIADLPRHLLAQVLVNGERVTFGSTPHPQFGYPVNEYRNGGSDHLWMKWYDGTQTTADPFLVSTASNDNRQWESTRVGRGVPYVIVTAKISQNMFSGFPTYKFVVSGLKLYDPSKDSTVPGGSGSHRWNNPATWGGDGDNYPVVQIYNLLRGIEFEGEWFYGLQSVTGARLPTARWITQINKCRSGNTYRSGGEIPVDVQLATTVEALLTACQGRISEVGGFYYIHVGEPDAPVASFTDGDILSTEEQSFTPFFGLSDTINGIAATYPSPADGWNEKAAPPLYRTDLEVLAGNRRLMADVALSFVPYPEQAQRLMKSALAEAQRARRHTHVLPPEYWPYAVPGVTFSWTSARNGYVYKWFRIDGVVDRANLDVMVDLTEVDPDDYDWDSELDFKPPVDGALGTLRPAPQPLVGWQVFPTTIGAPGKEVPSIRVAFPGHLDDVRAVRVQARLASESAPLFDGEVPYGDPATNDTPASVVLSGTFAPDTGHLVRGIFIPYGSRRTYWSEWLPVTTPNVPWFDAQARFELALATATDEVLGSMAQQVAQMREEMELLGKSTIQSLALGQGNRAAVTVETTERVEKDRALAQQITTAIAQMDDIDAAVQQEIMARVEQGSSLAQLISTATSQIDEQRLTVQVLQQSWDGIAGRIAMVMNANGHVIGYASLDGDVSGTNFTVAANRFQVALLGATGGGAVSVFAIANVNGVPKLALRADMFADGTITARHLASVSVSALFATLGEIVAGVLRDPANKYRFEVALGRFRSTDNKFLIDAPARRILAYGN